MLLPESNNKQRERVQETERTSEGVGAMQAYKSEHQATEKNPFLLSMPGKRGFSPQATSSLLPSQL